MASNVFGSEKRGRARRLRAAGTGQDGGEQIERLPEVSPTRHSCSSRMETSALPVRDYTAAFSVDDNGDGTRPLSGRQISNRRATIQKSSRQSGDFLRLASQTSLLCMAKAARSLQA
jgi:hypothetical protein